MKLTFIEGSRNVGKTYLIEKSNFPSYKFPFVSYFNEFIMKDDFEKSNSNMEAYHFSNGYDITLLSMHKLGLANTNVIYDRGFLSNIVLGIAGKRITIKDGENYIDFLHEQEYLNNIRIIQITSNISNDVRNKDAWHVLDVNQTNDLYEHFFKYLTFKNIHKFEYLHYTNHKQNEDIVNFQDMLLKNNQ